MANLHLYIQDAPLTFTNTVKGTWNDTTNSGDIGGLFNAPSGASSSLGIASATATTPWDVLLAMFNGAVAAQTISGTVQWVFGTSTSGLLNTYITKIHIWVSVGSTSTVRGTLLSNQIGVTNWSTTAQGIADGPFTLTPVTAQLNDCIVIEVGYRKTGVNITSDTGTLYFGSNASSPDLSSGDTNVTNDPGWIEFGIPIVMVPGFMTLLGV